jgi:hypothetical protein
VAGYELPSKVLDYRALLYQVRSKQGKSKKKAAAAAEGDKGGEDGKRMSAEEKLMLSMLKEESGVDALDRTMERVGVDIGKVMERVQTIAGGGKPKLDEEGGEVATLEPEEPPPPPVDNFVPEEGELEKQALDEPAPVFLEEDDESVSLYDKGWGLAENLVLIDGHSESAMPMLALLNLSSPSIL